MADVEMVERVARAIALDLGENPDELSVLIRGRDGKRPIWEGFESTARAAIEALREPTEAMKAAGDLSMADGRWDGPATCWDWMIDAILKEEGNG